MIRSFIALKLSSDVRDAMTEIQNEMRRHLLHARWTRPEGTHLTLQFLGEIEDDLVSEISTALNESILNHNAFQLELKGVGAFPRLSLPRVLWVGLKHSEELVKLQKSIESAVKPFGFEPEKRTFQGHLTLARLNGSHWHAELRRTFLETSPIADGIIFPVDEVVFFRSELKPGGAVYTPLRVYPLA